MKETGTKRKETSAVVTPEPKRTRFSLGEEGAEDERKDGIDSEIARASKEGEQPKVKDDETTSEHTGRDMKDADENQRFIYVQMDEGDTTYMGFGKYEAMTFRQVYTSDPGYYEWAKRVDFPSAQLRRFVDWVDASKDDDEGKTLLTVGKHKGQTYSYIANHFPGYVDWIRALNTPCKELKDFIEWTKTQKTLVQLPEKNAK